MALGEPRCTCGQMWGGTTAPPPCPVHGPFYPPPCTCDRCPSCGRPYVGGYWPRPRITWTTSANADA